MEPDGSAQVAVFVDFENLVLGAVKELPDQANPAPYEALTRLCRGYGNASVRRAYADWAHPRFGGHQEDLAMNGVDLIQVARAGVDYKLFVLQTVCTMVTCSNSSAVIVNLRTSTAPGSGRSPALRSLPWSGDGAVSARPSC
jgi:hypothetical protein